MEFKDIGGGLNTWAEPHAVANSECVDCLNMSFAKPGSVETRGGYTRAHRTKDSTILGIFEYFKEDGTGLRLVKAGTNLKTWAVNSSDVITIGGAIQSGLHATFKPFFVGFGNTVIIADKAKNYVYDGTNVTELGRDAPTGITAADGGTSGSLDAGAVYKYKFTFRSTSLGIESTVSGILEHNIGGSDNEIDLTLPAGVTNEIDSVWDKVRVYRSVGGGADYFLHSDVTTSFTDTTADGSLTTAIPSDTDLFKLPGARAAIEYLGRLWAVPDNELTNIYFSEAAKPNEFKSASVLRVGEQDGDKVLGFTKSHGRLYAIKQNSLYLLVGESSSNFQWIELEGALGGDSGRGTVSVAGITYVFNAANRIYRFRGSGVEPIGWKIRDYVLDNTDLSVAEDEVIAEYEPATESVWFAYKKTDATFEVIVYFTRTGAWSIYDIPVTSMALVHRGSNNKLSLLLGEVGGFLAWAEDGVSDGVPGGTIAGTVGAGSATTTIVTAGTLDTTGDDLENMKATVIFANGTIETREIASNTGTVITVSVAFSGAPEAGDLWFVAAIDTQWKGGVFDLGHPFYPKRVSTWKVALRANTSTQPLRARLNYDETNSAFSTADVDGGDKQLAVFSHGNTAHRFQAELRHVANDAPLKLYAIDIPGDVIGTNKAAVRK